MLSGAFRTESPGNTAPQTRRPVNDRAPPVGEVSGQKPFSGTLRTRRAGLPVHRQALINRVRLQIANGCYESEAKIEALLARLARDLGLARTL
jgi:hypothetical protein